MHLNDLLLLVAAICLSAAGFLVVAPLGFAVTGLSAGAMWFLLGEAS